MPFLAQMARQHRRKVRIAFGGEHGERMAERPNDDPGDPLLKAEAERCGERSIEDRNCPRSTAEQDRLDQRAVNGRLKAVDVLPRHQTNAPPPKLKKERKKDDAAKAIERPKMI